MSEIGKEEYESVEYWERRMRGEKVLNLSNNIGDEGVIALAGALEMNRTLIKLALCGNNIGIEGFIALAGVLETNGTLQGLALYFNNIGDEGAIALAGALETNGTLQTLWLYNNIIGDNLIDEIDEKTRRNRRFHALRESQYEEKRSVLLAFLKTYLLHDFIDEIMIWRGEKVGEQNYMKYDCDVWKELKEF